jgi:secreted trypsin-like serine protease
MKLLIAVLCALVFAVEACENGRFIIGGENALSKDYPYMAGVLNFGLPSCGGSIITARSVLTVKNRQDFCWSIMRSFFLGCSLHLHRNSRINFSLRWLITTTR